MSEPPKKPAYRAEDEANPMRAYAVILLFVVVLLGVVFFQDGSKDTQSTSNFTASTQRTERLGGSAGSGGSGNNGGVVVSTAAPQGAAAAFTPPPPAESIARQKMQALENTQPSLEPPKQCYWLENKATPPRWVPVTAVYGVALSKQSCFELDSCDGGLGNSKGDCYKWAASPTTERDPW
ncbi:MAG: hypothetical protein RIR70_2158 [Pseudomonadota bacterium]